MKIIHYLYSVILANILSSVDVLQSEGLLTVANINFVTAVMRSLPLGVEQTGILQVRQRNGRL
jgi:hypothetical protein